MKKYIIFIFTLILFVPIYAQREEYYNWGTPRQDLDYLWYSVVENTKYTIDFTIANNEKISFEIYADIIPESLQYYYVQKKYT